MSISGQNLSIVIVTLKSEHVIHECIQSIGRDIPIIVVENSNNKIFKEELESRYQNLKCILSQSNLGMGSGNNIGIHLANTEYVLILNPDVKLEHNTLEELYLASRNLKEFSILAPLSSDINFPNYGSFSKKNTIYETKHPFKVDFVDGFAMLLNKKKFKDNKYFDENFFLYLENNDMCIKVNKDGGSIYIVPSSIIKHAGAKTVDSKYKNEIELSRNWHWIWSKFYFNKKNFGLLKALRECSLIFLSSFVKFVFYLLVQNNFKKKIYFNRMSGFYNAFRGKPSWYRPDFGD